MSVDAGALGMLGRLHRRKDSISIAVIDMRLDPVVVVARGKEMTGKITSPELLMENTSDLRRWNLSLTMTQFSLAKPTQGSVSSKPYGIPFELSTGTQLLEDEA